MEELREDEAAVDPVVIEAAVGYEDAVQRWMAAFDVLAEYGRRADDTRDDP